MNFTPLSAAYPDLAALGQQAEDLILDRHYRESTQVMRQFAEGVLKTVLKVDRESYGSMMRLPLFMQLADSTVYEYFRRIREIGNDSSHFGGSPAKIVGQRERHYRVRTEDDAVECLKYGHGIAVWLMFLKDREFVYPPFRSPGRVHVTPDGTKTKTVFNSHQQKAIELNRGKHLVLAPPGCGKTAILTERIDFALSQGVPLEEMLCLTFTNRAARGMQDRIATRFEGRDMRELYVGNLHRFCSKLLFDNEVVPDMATILDEDDAHDIIEGLVLEDLPDYASRPQDRLPDPVTNYIQMTAALQYQKTHGFPLHTEVPAPAPVVSEKKRCEYEAYDLLDRTDYRRRLNTAKIERIAERYTAYKEAQQLLDFQDLLLKAWVYLTEKPAEVRRYRWIQVDEVQDLSPLQLDIITKLWVPEDPKSVCVYFGDEQQAIFSFMGAKLSTLTQLCETHELHRLYKNFRSPSYLLDMFNTFATGELGCDARILPQAVSKEAKPDDALRIVEVAHEYGQNDVIADVIKRQAEGRTTAIIVPTNQSADGVSHYLKNLNVPHFKISGTDIFRQNVLKVAKAYLSILKDDFHTAPWAQLIYRLTRVKKTSLKRIRDYLAVEFPKRGLLASDLIYYSQHDDGAPVSALDDFARAYEGELVVFDTETTGLEIGLDEVVQIAAVKLRAGVVVDRLVLFLETTRPIPEMLGNIPNPMVAEYAAHQESLVSPEEGFNRFLDFVGHAPVVGHNVEYDANIVNAQYAVLKDQLHKLRAAQGTLRDRQINMSELEKRFDTLKLSHALAPLICQKTGLAKLPSHKLKDLIAVLHLEGSNTHKADDDVEATVHLLRWVYEHAASLIEEQKRFLRHPNLVAMSDMLRNTILPILSEHRNLMYRRMPADDEAILVQVFRQLIETLPNYTEDAEQIDNIRKKLPLIYEYFDRVLIDKKASVTLYSQLQRYLVSIHSLKEPDLCSSGIIRDKVFISTVHKAKGLEFDNVIVTNVVENTYPFFASHTEEAVLEDARKLYVAMTRTKASLVLLTPRVNAHGYEARPSRFLRSVKAFFD